MKNILIKFLLIIMLIPLTFTACTDDFEQMNVNPNQPTAVPNTNLLVSSITSGTRRILGENFNMTYAGLWSQQYAKIQYIDEDKYAYRSDAFDSHWGRLYAGALLTSGLVVPGPLQDLQIIINKTGSDEPNMKAAAMVMQAYYFSVMTDMWGDIPYSEALKGTEAIQPKFDTQESIYKDLEQKLATAASMFDEGADDLGQGDVLYGGDISKWRKFANTLRARILNRYKHKDAAAASALTALLNSGDLMTSNADDADLYYTSGAADTTNPIYENRNIDNRVDHAVSKTMVDLLSSINDPRLPVIAASNDEGNYVGQPNGSVQPVRLTAVSYVGSAFIDDPTAPTCIITYAELMFIKAEAMNDKQAYMDGITASMDKMGVSADQDYMDAASAFYDTDALEAIITHKWITLFGNGPEAYTEYRRTKYPASIQEVPQSVYPGRGIPHRFAYPTSEYLVNETNLQAAIESQGLSDDASGVFGNEMWWIMR
ncbi:MAG: SusD/RagB family nutrient-binding outer membrane lipoprotein [Chitinophagales bacterium]